MLASMSRTRISLALAAFVAALVLACVGQVDSTNDSDVGGHRQAVTNGSVPPLLEKASEYERRYDWNNARTAYEDCLRLEPNNRDAKEGYARTSTLIRALQTYEECIGTAEQLANRADFQGAIRRFNDAMAVKPSYLVMSDRVQRLHALLMTQNTPEEVTLKSDGNTWVHITGHRAPQKIPESITIKILPGDYELVGRRRGYRDVNLLMQIRNGTPPPTFSVICEERIDTSNAGRK